MAFSPSKSSSKAKAGHGRGIGEYEDPNLVPMMNIMLLMLPVIIQYIQFVKYTEIAYNPSPDVIVYGDPTDMSKGGGGSGVKVDKRPQLNLLLNVTEAGFQISVLGGMPGQADKFWEVPAINGRLDYAGLERKLYEVRKNIIGDPTSVKEVRDPATGKLQYAVEFKYADAHQIKIAAKGNTEWKVFTKLFDMFRVYRDGKLPDGTPIWLFKEPVFGQIQ